MTRLAIGLVHRPSGTPPMDRDWARALVVRHSRDRRLHLLDILEIDDDADRTREVIRRLADAATSARAAALITDGVDSSLAESIARDLDLSHEAVAPRARAELASVDDDLRGVAESRPAMGKPVAVGPLASRLR